MSTIRAASAHDVDRLCAIYNHYVLNDVATFEETPVSADEMRKRVEDVQSAFSWLVYEADGPVLGFAYAGRWKPRAAYRHSVELSVYIDPECVGRGIGKQLYADLLRRLRETNVNSVIGGVAGNNALSVALHHSFGFEQVAHLRNVGYKFGRWIDVRYFQILLQREQRSTV
jgi:phosphinothricin acetyltransferase